MLHKVHHQKRPLRVAFGSPWKTIHPGLQHTLVGDLVLSNQFEALIGTNEFGVSVPLAAKSWEVSPDFKTFTFHIDTSRTFSNGGTLSAQDFKRSWEEALALEPKSSNSSLLDIMYKIEGFEDFEKTKTLTGIEAQDESTLRVHFKSPFRMALSHFQGNRFSAYRHIGEQFFGTGNYTIREEPNNHLAFLPNPKAIDFDSLQPMDISIVQTADAVDKLLDGTIDVFAYGRGSSVSEVVKDKHNLSVVVGQDALHETTILNLLPGRFFSNVHHRLAMQYLIHNAFAKNGKLLGNTAYSSVDGQVFLPWQTGHLEEAEVEALIAKGRTFVPELILASEAEPVVVFTSEGDDWLIPFLKENGIAISPRSKKIVPQDRISIIYKTHEPDIIVAAFGVASGDPDGIYHRLGKSGAIMTPMSYSDDVADLLEEGRKLTKQEELDPLYRKVSLMVLQDVPFVHIGYSKAVAIYRNDRVEFDAKLLRRNEGHLHGFKLK